MKIFVAAKFIIVNNEKKKKMKNIDLTIFRFSKIWRHTIY